MDAIAALPAGFRRRREKVFGEGRCQPLDRNAKARIMVYARAWSARHRRPGQHRGPLTRATLEVLEALLWGFHKSRDGDASRVMRPSRRVRSAAVTRCTRRVSGGENPRVDGDGGVSVNLAVSLSPVCVERAAVLVAVKDASRREGAVAFGHPRQPLRATARADRRSGRRDGRLDRTTG